MAKVCDNCGEELGPEPAKRGDKVYCCKACAYDAARSVDCGGRTDSTMPGNVVEPLEK